MEGLPRQGTIRDLGKWAARQSSAGYYRLIRPRAILNSDDDDKVLELRRRRWREEDERLPSPRQVN